MALKTSVIQQSMEQNSNKRVSHYILAYKFGKIHVQNKLIYHSHVDTQFMYSIKNISVGLIR